MSVQKCYLKSVRLYPTEFCVDVWICDDEKVLAEIFHKYYGASVEFYKEEMRDNYSSYLHSTEDSLNKGDTRLLVRMDKMNIGVLVHELNHVFYHLCKIIKAEVSYSSQEWHSYMLEYLYEETKDIKTYKIIENELPKVPNLQREGNN